MDKKILAGLSLAQIEEITESMGASRFRAKQIHNWIYVKSVKTIDEMTDLSKSFREELSKGYVVSKVNVKAKQVSQDGTLKYLIEYEDGNTVETVLMRFDNRANLTACVSSQIGCAVNCDFCATGKRGFIRNLTSQEIIEQVLTIQRDTGLKVTNIVFMGQGEPMLNFDNVMEALNIFNTDFQIGARRITVSTSGIAPKILDFAKVNNQSTLAISLHAPNNTLRDKIMPINKKFPMEVLKKALNEYHSITNNRVTIEYILIKDYNDTVEVAKELAIYLKDIKCNINLIPYNPISTDSYQKPTNKAIMKFKYLMEHSGKKVTVRLERGADIDAACGQLKGKVEQVNA